MGRFSAITDPICALHDNPQHPECNARLAEVCSGLLEDTPLLMAEPASYGDVTRVHDPGYIRWLEQCCAAVTTIGYLDADTYITPRSFEVALHAAGAAIAAVSLSLGGEHCFALVRPPGHHAEPDRAMGFCLINNVAVAAKKALDSVDRIAIVDWDVHHGNGTQASFYGSDRVLYCSVHREFYYPYSGSTGETGAGNGKGFTINAPLQAGSTIADYGCVFSEIFVPAIERFSPDAMIVSAGQDILFDDPLGGMKIQPQDFEHLVRMLIHASDLPLALVLEGGYSPSHGAAVSHIFSALRSDGEVNVATTPFKRTQHVVSVLKKIHNIP